MSFNLLETRLGRLIAFFLLYMTEGIPLGFAATAIATQLRRDGIGPAEIGAFVGSFYLPWGFKWAFGPIIDVLEIPGLGRRRGWILVTQGLMASTLAIGTLIPLPSGLWLFTIVLLVHNTFGAMQDVAIDALAVNVLSESERGLANGVMFAGANIGIMLGGAAILALSTVMPFQATYFVVAGMILAVTVFVVFPMREPKTERVVVEGDTRTPLVRIAGDMHAFALTAFRSFLGSRGAFAGVFFAILPAGAMSLGLTLQSNLAVELGMSDASIGALSMWSSIINAIFCIAGGWVSDRFGRRATLVVSIALMSLPVLYLAGELLRAGWIMPAPEGVSVVAAAPAWLVTAFIVACLAYSIANGVMYGVRSAIMMDVTNPRVAGTQFTAYMALMNVAIAYSATWQGASIEAWGYPRTMLIDAVAGVLCLALVPLMLKRGANDAPDAAAPKRARFLAILLGSLCVGWIAYSFARESLGAASAIFETLFTLGFISGAVFLLASAATLWRSAPTQAVVALVVAPLLMLLYARHWSATFAGWLEGPLGATAATWSVHAIFLALAAAGAVTLFSLVSNSWNEVREREDAA
ncbi:MAG: MFS transporter [Phycisphaerae bacterium]|nr:MFS transporter [Phycisphaerae bacterium]